jgi:hypothetical protein
MYRSFAVTKISAKRWGEFLLGCAGQSSPLAATPKGPLGAQPAAAQTTAVRQYHVRCYFWRWPWFSEMVLSNRVMPKTSAAA